MKPSSARRLRSGFTTGTSAAAAAKGALLCILDQKRPREVQIMLLTGRPITIPVHSCEMTGEWKARCTVIKDAGDDPDVTHHAEIGARVSLKKIEPDSAKLLEVEIVGGEGVGRVTKPGLEVPPGKAAINPGPCRMITEALTEAMKTHNLCGSVRVEVFVPAGRVLAQKTLNARLGIVGGISILGTTGVVRPMSHDAYVATIRSAMSVARATGNQRMVLSTGRRSERFAQSLFAGYPEESFIQIGDYFGVSLETAATHGFTELILAVFFGKAVKMAQGVSHTHAATSRMSLEKLSEWTLAETGDKTLADFVRRANTAREAFERLLPEHPRVIRKVGQKMVHAAARFSGRGVAIQSVIFDYRGDVAAHVK